MPHLDTYRDSFPNARLTRSKTGVLEVALHTDGGTLVFNGHTHEQFVDLFHAIGSDPDNRVVILTGSGDAFMERITLDGFDFFTPRGYDKIYREGKKVLMNLLDIEVPLIAAVNGPVRLHSEYILLADVVLATPSTLFQDKPHFEFGIVSGDREDREQFEKRRHLPFDDVKRAALRIGIVGVDAGAHDQFALVALADIDMHRARHDDAIQDRLDRLRHQRLQGMALQREAHPGHRRHDRIVPGGADRDLVGIDRAAAGVDPDHPSAGGTDRGHLAILDDVDAPRIGGAGIAPGDRIVARHPAAPLQGPAQHRVARIARNVDDRAEPLDCGRVEP